MAKGSLFWANASGKLGEAVFYRAGGEQRTRSYVKNIKNPKTLAQAEQRLSMLNFSAGFRALKPLLAFSFPNKLSRQSGFNAFVKANKAVDFPVITREGANEGLAVLGDAVISSGSLTEYGSMFRIAEQEYGDSMKVGIVYNFRLPSDNNEGQPSTEFNAWALTSSNGILYIENANDYKKFLSLFGLPNDLVVNIVKAEYEDEGYRYTISTISADGISGEALGEFGLVSAKFNGEESLPFLPEAQVSLGMLVDAEDSDDTYYGIVLSRKVDGKINVTNTRMMPVSSNVDLTAQFRKGGDVYNQLMAQYQPSSGNILSV